jgi:hypothetical protein
MPATAVGKAKGMSTMASTSFRPGKEYRTNTHATSSPKIELMSAATADAPNVSRKAAKTRGDVTVSQKGPQPMVADLAKIVERGLRTIRLR